jgi:hypothetical protein
MIRRFRFKSQTAALSVMPRQRIARMLGLMTGSSNETLQSFRGSGLLRGRSQ